tara:strand:- start:131 stop:466 length:336 start_codon:yes stop_codon:yes gene_type:complete
MRAHVIEKGLVVNTIEVDSLDFMPNLVEATEGGIGWSYVDGIFTEPADTRTDADIAAEVRTERDAKLSATDWTQVADAPVDQAAWATYRQSLRAVPEQAGFPNAVEWPTEP